MTMRKLAGILIAALLTMASIVSAEESLNQMPTIIPNHWVVIHVVLSKPLSVNGDAGMVVGYYQSLGVASEPTNLRALIERHVQDGTVDWADSEVEPIDPTNLDEETRQQIVPVSGEGIWYQSGRSFHGPD
jgi:hypothetical protein